MKVKRFGLGVRFDIVDHLHEADIARQMWKEIFSVLTVTDVSGMMLHGGIIDGAPGGAASRSYLCVFTNGSLSEMRRVFNKLDNDAGINMYLSARQPYLQTKALGHVEGLTYIGRVHRDGSVLEGDASVLESIRINKKHGKQRPVGKGIRFLFAPDSFGEELSSMQAIKSLTLAARGCFAGVRILPLPMTWGGEGTLDALLMACDGVMHSAKVTAPGNEGRMEAKYAVLRGKLAVIEFAAVLGKAPREAAGLADGERAYSFAAGELVRRVLDEGIRDICICMGGCYDTDYGLGFLQGLGVKLYDQQGNGLTGMDISPKDVFRVDLEFLHPRAGDARYTLMCDSEETMRETDGITPYCDALAEAAGQDIAALPGSGMGGGLAAAVMAALKAKPVPSVQAMLEAAAFDRLIKGVSLVVTGEGKREHARAGRTRVVEEVVKHCESGHIPVAIVTDGVWEDAKALLRLGTTGISVVPEALDTQAVERFESAANRMFGMIRMGREIEKITRLRQFMRNREG